MTHHSPLLSFSNISKSYPGVRALSAARLELRPGEIHALIGENGAGKSTFIKIITGVLPPDDGADMIVCDQRVTNASPKNMQALGVAAVYQNPTLFHELSVAENLCIAEKGAAISWKQRREFAQALLARIAVSLDVDQPVKNLRIAEKQLLEIARALGRNARVLILDEPTASLSQQDADRLLAIVEKLRAEGVGIIYISHRLEEVLRIADRITVLRDGNHIGTYEKSTIDRAGLIQLMAGRDLAELFPKLNVPAGPVILETRRLACASAGMSDINITVRRGEILGLAGLVGAGRTELARTLFGLTPASAGEIVIDGKPVLIRSVNDAVAQGLAYVPEDRKEHGVVEDLPIVENITLALLRRLNGAWLDTGKEDALATTFFARLGIKAPDIFAQTRTLSGGNQQKVALARWLATEPRILILDEPTQGIDIGAKAEIHRLMGQLAQQGLAIILISSELPELLGLADRIAVMRKGRIAGTLDARAATRESVLHLAMEDAA